MIAAWSARAACWPIVIGLACMSTTDLAGQDAGGRLTPGRTFTAQLGAGERHEWHANVVEGRFVRIDVRQRGVDVVVTAANPSGTWSREYDSPNGSVGTETVRMIAASAGEWRVSVAPLEEASAGAYEITWVEHRPPTDDDRVGLRADSLLVLAMQEQDEGKAAEAEAHLTEALETRTRLLGPDHPEVAAAMHRVAELYASGGRRSEAERLHLGALERIERALPPEHPGFLISLYALSDFYALTGRFERVGEYQRRVATIVRRELGADHPETAASDESVAMLLFRQARYAEAEALLTACLETYERALGPRHPLTARALGNLALILQNQGRHADAEPLLRRALSIEESVLGPLHPRVGIDLNNLGTLFVELGRFAEAEEAFGRALRIAEATDSLSDDVALRLNNLGAVYRYQGRYAEVVELLERALAISTEMAGREHPSTAVRLANLGGVYGLQGRYDEAVAALREAVATFEAALGPGHPNVAILLAALAVQRRGQGAHPDAEELLGRAVEIIERSLGTEHPETAKILHQLATTIAERGLDSRATIERALAHNGRAVDILTRTRTFPTALISALTLQFDLRRRVDDAAGAERDLAEAIRVAEETRLEAGGGEEGRTSFFAQYADAFDRMVEWQLERGRPEAAFEYAERGRARLLLDQMAAARVDLKASIDPVVRVELERRESAARARVSEYQQRIRIARSRPELPEDRLVAALALLGDSLALADRDYREALNAVRSASVLWRDIIMSGGRPVDPTSLQRRVLLENRLMLFYQASARASHVLLVPPASEGGITAVGLVVSPEDAAVLGIEPGALTAQGIRRIMEGPGSGLLTGLARRGQTSAVGIGGRSRAAIDRWHAAWRVLLPPAVWTAVMASAETIIVPDADLHHLPFEALVVERGGAGEEPRYWLDVGPPVRYAGSATSLFQIETRPSAGLGQTGILSLSDPIYDADDVARASSGRAVQATERTAGAGSAQGRYTRLGGSLSRLPGTARETDAIRLAFEPVAAAQELGILQQLDATEMGLRASITDKRYVHLATHGLVDETRGDMFSALALTPTVEQAPDPSNDGFLQLHEIYELQLEKVQLAVLSACESNVGRAVDGEGIFALSRGFLAGGARRVVASQWAVDDVSTAEIMAALFRDIASAERAGRRVAYSRALRDAKLTVRRQTKWADPYYWAPFVLTGEG